MVTLTKVIESNSRFASEQHEGRVCVFAGATMGIGFGTLRQMATMLRSSTFYVLGRSEAKFADQLARLRASAPTCTIVFVETQVSLIASVDAACKRILAAEKKVDYLCMTPGGIPFQGAVYTEEGLETCFAISYYSRLRILSNLWPLLQQSPQARVLSILNGTKEKRIDETDLGLNKKWSIMTLVNHSTICTSLAFDHWAANDDKKTITFIHATPGLVHTGSPRTMPARKDGLLWWAFLSVLQPVMGWMVALFGFSLEESAHRQAYRLTSDQCPAGSWRTDQFNEIPPDSEALVHYRENGWTERIWEHTLRVWDQALAKGSSL